MTSFGGIRGGKSGGKDQLAEREIEILR